MRLTHLFAAAFLALLAATALAPTAAADFPGYGNSGDNADDFAVWCTLNLGDCTNDSPMFIGQDFGCAGDLACYALYCTWWNPIHQCVL